MKKYKIVLTGGPCAGKTTAIEKIVDYFTEKGFKVFIVNETATELINGNIRPFGDNPIDIVDFQRFILKMQYEKEMVYDKAASLSNQDSIIICDRGIMDNRAYINDEIFNKLLSEMNLDYMDIISSYDLVLHLTTAALGAEEFYTTANNSARTETVDKARELDKKTLNSWVGHEKLKIIGNTGSFDDKMESVLKEMSELINVDYPIQRQRKYLVKEINLDKINDTHVVKLDIEQFFIELDDNDNTMVRKVTKDGSSYYTITRKRDTNIVGERITTSRNISEKEYLELCSKYMKTPIVKSRYCFTVGRSYYRLDLFKDSNLMILESDKNLEDIPEFIDIDRDITSDISYRNISIYKDINKGKDKVKVKEKSN